MYQLRHISTVCGASRSAIAAHNLTERECEQHQPYSIFGVGQLPNAVRSLWLRLPAHGTTWNAGLYPLLYWFVLSMSLYALWLTAREIERVWHGHSITRLYRNATVQKYCSASTRRRARLGAAALMVLLLGLLIVGVAGQFPVLMNGWLTVQALVIAAEIGMWVTDLWCAVDKFSVRTAVTFACVYAYWLAVWTVQNTFVVMGADRRHRLSLFGG